MNSIHAGRKIDLDEMGEGIGADDIDQRKFQCCADDDWNEWKQPAGKSSALQITPPPLLPDHSIMHAVAQPRRELSTHINPLRPFPHARQHLVADGAAGAGGVVERNVRTEEFYPV